MIEPSRPERARRGAVAEDLAAAYLRLVGCEIVGRNVRIGGGEIDLIARRGRWVFLVEVRFRRGVRHGHPIETIRGRKARALTRAAHALLARGRGGASCWRLDVITVVAEPDGEVRIRSFPDVVPL